MTAPDYPALKALGDQVAAAIEASGLPVAGFVLLANHPEADMAVSEVRHRTTPLQFRAALAKLVRTMKVG